MTTKYTYCFLIFLVTALMFLMFHQSAGTVQVASSQDARLTDLPVVDYELETATAKTKARKTKDSHFKGAGNPDDKKPIAELPPGVEPLPTNGHWWIGLSPLPVEQSDVVVLGRILGREAHLAED